MNDAIDLHTPIRLTYPTIDTLAKCIWSLGVGMAVYKKDLLSAFRQLIGDPMDYSLMMYHLQGKIYVDIAVAMGLRSAPSCCQRGTNAITHVHKHNGYWVMNYIDDFISAEYWSRVWDSYNQLGELLKTIGAAEFENKSSPPDTMVECLGTIVNTLNMTLQVKPEQMQELLQLLEQWRMRVTATRKQLESLIGKLQFVATCVQQGHVFMSRLLNWLKTMKRGKFYKIPHEARQDIKWWYIYLPKYNGTSMLWYLHKEDAQAIIMTDASFSGCGGYSEVTKQYFRSRLPMWLLQLAGNNIVLLEMHAVIMAIKIWGKHFAGWRFHI